MSDTIYAISSGAPPAAIAIVRVSGPGAFSVGQRLVGTLPEPRQAALRALRDPRDRSLLDRALVLVFPAPRSATGEDLVEFHVHGGRAVVAAVEATIGLLGGTRRAEAGEFTRRALENGVIDLTAAEGLGDLLSAQTETQRRAALRMAEGGVRALVEGWTHRVVAVAARIESQLDFSDSDDVTDDGPLAVRMAIAGIAEEIREVLSTPAVERLHEGLRVVIAGPPNSGKSTLLNALTGREVAIVSPISGTTRDRIEATVIRNGVAYVLTDTAGLTDQPSDTIEAIGVDRAKSAITAADITVWLDDSEPLSKSHIAVHARIDLPTRSMLPDYDHVAVSGKSGLGIDALWTEIARRGVTLLPTEDAVAINARQRHLLKVSFGHLITATRSDDLLLVAEDIRLGMRSLHAIVGHGDVEAVLDAVFSKFCIGK